MEILRCTVSIADITVHSRWEPRVDTVAYSGYWSISRAPSVPAPYFNPLHNVIQRRRNEAFRYIILSIPCSLLLFSNPIPVKAPSVAVRLQDGVSHQHENIQNTKKRRINSWYLLSKFLPSHSSRDLNTKFALVLTQPYEWRMNFSEHDLACFLKIPIWAWTETEESFLSEAESTPGP